ncbi:MAG: family 2A encapsulin nanocompartment cargo protein cysteine desulfurase [Burkholderiaceae bacterium]
MRPPESSNAAPPPGLPDPAELARLAAALFAVPPTAASPTQPPASVPQSSSVPSLSAVPQPSSTPSLSAAPQSPSVPSLSAAPQSPSVPSLSALPQSPSVPSLSALPQSPSVASLSVVPSPVSAPVPTLASLPATGGVPVPAAVHPPGLSLPPGSAGPATPVAVPFGAYPPGLGLVPTSPQLAANPFASTPSLLPHALAPNGVPDTSLTAAPGYDGRLGSQLSGLPASPPVAGAAYYFLSEAGIPGDARLPTTAVPASAATTASPAPAIPSIASTASAPSIPSVSSLAPVSSPPSVSSIPSATVPDAPAVPRLGGLAPFDVHAVRGDFPILAERVNGQPLVWFDNAATTQKPRCVIERLKTFYERENSNIHRAAHELAARATDAYEGAREIVRRFIGARSTDEIVFVRGTTEAINLVAKTWGASQVGAGDEIIVSHLEHHANIVPWQQLAAEKGARIRVIPVDDDGQVRLDEYQKLLNERTRIVSVTQVSNALGTVVPVRQIVDLAHRAGAVALVDGAQSVSHMRVDVQRLGADFFVFSGHKIFGPTGIGVVYGRRELLEAMPPWQGGGNMIADVTFERTIYHGPPTRFEAGTGNIADAVGLGAALEYVERLGIEAIQHYEHALLDYATWQLRAIPGLRLIGTAPDKASVLSFVLDGYTTDAVGQALNEQGIAVRTGHHCAQPILRRFGVETTVRPSLAFYNTCEEVDRMVDVVQRLARSRPPAGRAGAQTHR